MDLEGDILEIGHKMTTPYLKFSDNNIEIWLKLDFNMGFCTCMARGEDFES